MPCASQYTQYLRYKAISADCPTETSGKKTFLLSLILFR